MQNNSVNIYFCIKNIHTYVYTYNKLNNSAAIINLNSCVRSCHLNHSDVYLKV